MLPKLVTRNVTNDRVGGIVFRNKIIPKKASTNQTKRSLPKATTAISQREEGGIEFDSRNHSQIDGSRKNEALEKMTRGYCFYE